MLKMESSLVRFAVLGCCVLLLVLHSCEATGSRVNRNLLNLFRRGKDFYTSYTATGGEYTVFPPTAGATDSYFSDQMDFTTFQDRLLIGAADELYLLDMDLTPVQNGVLFWNSTVSNFDSCSRDQKYANRASYYCRNHIRLYSRYPAEADLLFVCGTQSVRTAQCRAVNVSGGSFTEAYEATDMEQRILSVNPDYPSYGLFRDRPGDNMSLITWFFFEQSVNYLYMFDLQNIEWNATTKTMSNTIKFEKLNNWISEPMYIVDFLALSYRLSEAGPSRNFDYYYAFIRERNAYKLDYTTSAEPGSISYVLRVCQDDPGANYSDSTPPSFGTALKARLYCDFEGPNTGNNPLAARDMRYNDIWGVTFSKSGVDGVINSNGRILMYAAFSGPLTGPPGSAICTFPAQASVLSNTQRNQGLFDTFREDIIVGSPTSYTPMNHDYFDCTGNSRPSEGSGITTKTVLVSERLSQINGNPLLILDGYYVTSMTTDVTCVVMASDPTRCQLLDVLFVGTSNGTILKVWGGEQLDKVVAEEISLEPDIYVRDLKVKEAKGVKFIYASTLPRLYKLSMGRCRRHNSLSDCVGSRDPYCFWNGMNNTCESVQFNSSDTVPLYIVQNVFDGYISDIMNVTLTAEQRDVVEGGSLDVAVSANGTVPEGWLSISIYSANSTIGGSVSVSRVTTGTSVTMEVDIPEDSQFLGTQEVNVCLQSGDSGVVLFNVRCVSVTVIDNDASWVSFAQSRYEVVEGNELKVTIMANKTISNGVLTLSLYQGDTVVVGPVNVSGFNRSITVPLNVPDDSQFLGRWDYRVELRASASAGVTFDIQNASVLVIDSDGFFAQVGLKDLDDVCERWKVTDVDNKVKSLNNAILAGVGGGFTIESNGLFCLSNANQLYVAVYRFNVTTQNNNAPQLFQAFRLWVNKGEKITPFSFSVDDSCVSKIHSLQDDLCGSLLVGALRTPGSGPSAEVVGLAVVFVVSLVANVALVAGLVLLCYFYKKSSNDTLENHLKDAMKMDNGTNAHRTDKVPSPKHTENYSQRLEKRDLAKSHLPNLHLDMSNTETQNGVNSPTGDSAAPLIGPDGQETKVTPFFPETIPEGSEPTTTSGTQL